MPHIKPPSGCEATTISDWAEVMAETVVERLMLSASECEAWRWVMFNAFKNHPDAIRAALEMELVPLDYYKDKSFPEEECTPPCVEPIQDYPCLTGESHDRSECVPSSPTRGQQVGPASGSSVDSPL